MNPKNLTLKKFLGIRAGLNRDSITIDLSAIDGELIALTGETGQGKTTILDNLHPYRLMPSRAGSYSPGAFSFYDHCYEDAMKELEFEHGEVLYRSILKIKAGGKTKKTEAYLQLWGGGEWRPLNDGKTATYDAALEAVMGSPELFFTSAFACQNRPLLANYTNGDIKTMLAELLNLDHIKDLGKGAKDKRITAQTALEGVHSKVSAQAAVEEDIAAAQTALNSLLLSAEGARATVDSQEVTLQGAREDLIRGQEQLKNAGMLTARRTELEEALKAISAQAEQAKTTHNAVCLQCEREMTRANDQLLQIVSPRNAEIARLGFEFGKAQQLMTQEGDIDSAAEMRKMLVTEKMDLDDEYSDALELVETHRALESKRARVDSTLSGLVAQIEGFEATILDLDQRSELISEVPCTSNITYVSACPLLDNARNCADKATATRAQLLSTLAAKTTTLTELDQIDGQLSACETPDVGGIQSRAEVNRAAMDACLVLASKKDALADAREKCETIPPLLAEAHDAVEKAQADDEVATDEYRRRVDESDIIKNEALDKHRVSYATTTEKLKAIPAPDAIDLTWLESDVEDGLRKLTQYKKFNADADEEVSSMKGKISFLQQGRVPAVDGELEAAEFDLAQWKLLEKALGNDGIISLSIDDCGGTIASIANDLLLACFGPRYTVKIITQEETASGTMKETFDIIVFDAQTNEEKSVSVMSGGQTTYINEILTRSVGLFQAQNSGQSYGCLFADESDGGLDSEKKVEFMKMKREVLRAGGYEREFFISHTPSLWAMADARIDVGGYAQ